MRITFPFCISFSILLWVKCQKVTYYFPDGFLFGTSTASYQIEGAWNVSGKGENIWDFLTHRHPENVIDGSNGDVASDFYHKYKEDIALLKELGVDFFRLSMSWARIFPTGHPYRPSPAGISFYNAVLDELTANNISAMVTLYHWDLPQKLQELGGWTNPRIIDYFAEYARTAFENFGDRVKYWITINEPHEICKNGYGDNNLAPALNMSGIADYLCGHNVLRAHAAAYHIYNNTYRHRNNGEIGISIQGRWFEPNTTDDAEAAERMMQFTFGWWANPIFSSGGDYPKVMRERIASKSSLQGYKRSRLPQFTESEIEYLKGTSDFIGLNHYSAFTIFEAQTNVTETSFENDLEVKSDTNMVWGDPTISRIKVTPWGFRRVLSWLKSTYGERVIHVTENGFCDEGQLNDTGRISYFGQYLESLLEAIHIDNVTVKSYSAWSFLDNFEWLDGYTVKCQSVTYYFPDDFLFGTSSASYQIEGAWNVSGKGESIWDFVIHNHPERVLDGSNGDVACDFYHKYKEDIALLKELGVDFFRFSISWTRIFPTGHPYRPSAEGIAFYSAVLDELAANNISAMVTLYHWDLPQKLQELGGWANSRIIDYFAEYARVAFENFGDRVKYWITVNEPHQICQDGYGAYNMAPFLNMSGIADYLCGHNVLRAHAAAYHIYNDTYKSKHNGEIGISIHGLWYLPNTTDDAAAAERMMQFTFGWWANPIFSSEGDYPMVMRERIADRSSLQGYRRSRLPEFTKTEIEYLKGTSDFLGLNHYTTYPTSEAQIDAIETSFENDHGVHSDTAVAWGDLSRIKVVPAGFRSILTWLKNTYGEKVILVTENGFSDRGQLNDTGRISYFGQYLEALLAAIHIDNVTVRGYAAWTFMDNFEWLDGYTIRFGIYQVNFSDPSLPRTPKASATFFKNIIGNRTVVDYEIA